MEHSVILKAAGRPESQSMRKAVIPQSCKKSAEGDECYDHMRRSEDPSGGPDRRR